MNTPDSGAFAINAAGIADSMCTLAHTEPSGDARTARLSEHFGGAAGVMARIAEAGVAMESYRITRGSLATWGGELPYL